MKMTIEKATRELDKSTMFWGNIPDVLEENKIYDKKDVKTVLDNLGIENKKLRHFVYDQMEARKEQMKKVI